MATSISRGCCVSVIWRKNFNRRGHLLRSNDTDTWLNKWKHYSNYNSPKILDYISSKSIDFHHNLHRNSRCCLHLSFKHRLLNKLAPFSNDFPQFSNPLRCFSSSSGYFSDQDPNNGRDNKEGSVLKLMDFPEIVWPSVMYTIKNWILSKLIIRPYLDKDFTLDEFGKGAKQAFLLISKLILQGKLDNLQGLITPDALEEIKRNFSCLNMRQRQHFEIVETDIYFNFPYQVGIMLDDSGGIQKRFVEITMCFHSLLGSEELKKRDPTMSELYKFKDRIVICNCRFIKEFTKGSESDWTVNVINYFQPSTKG